MVRNDELTTTDGPFVEMKEALGGFYVFECENHDEAVKIASEIPDARTGAVEVRPVMEIPSE